MRLFGLVSLTLTLTLVSCKGDDDTDLPDGPDPYDVTVGPYDVTIKRTDYGIPHIQGDDYGSVAYGLGYSFATDHVCVLADQILKVRGERSQYFGAGVNDSNVNSDFGWLHQGVLADAEAGWFDIRPELQQMLIGYTAGYNRYLQETPAADRPPACANADWVKPITHIDLVAYHLHLGLFGSGYALNDLIATAQPPRAAEARRTVPDISVLDVFNNLELGSNGWAIGSEMSSTGRGMVLSNTHFPSQGERQWYEFHLQGPDGLDVYGSSLVGVPMVNIGFNRDVAWTHTVSNNPRFTFYTLELDPADPTRYMRDGEFTDMDATTYRVDVLESDGSMSTRERTLYRSHYGPMLNAPSLGWLPLTGFTYRDANALNFELYDTWFEMNIATSLDEFKAAHRDHLGIPWVHTIAADKEGTAFYTDSANTPNLPEGAEAAWESFRQSDPFAGLFFEQAGLYVFPGDDPQFEWQDDERSPRPGVVPFDDAPQQERFDYLVNANENHWLTNALEPLEGYSWMFAETGTPRTPRTKMNHRYLLETGADSARGEDGLLSLDEMEQAVLSARSSIAMDLRDDLVDRCSGQSTVTIDVDGSDVDVDISDACTALAAWDGRYGVQSQGAHIMREWLTSGEYSWFDVRNEGPLFARPFDAADPVYTPNTLAFAPITGDDKALVALGMAVYRLNEAGIDATARLGDIQFRRLGDQDIPTLGSKYQDGVIAIADFSLGGDTTLLPDTPRGTVVHADTDLTDEGYVVNAGNSWIMAMQYTDSGPQARAVMVYGQSEDPRSPHFADQSVVYGEERLRPVLFEQADIDASEALVTIELEHPEE